MNLTRNGKIARLPLAVRQELNRRLDEGEQGKKLVAWLNSLPEVQAIMTAEFGGKPITEQNLVERFCGVSDREMLEIIEREWGRVLPTSYAEHVGLMIEAGFRQSLVPI